MPPFKLEALKHSPQELRTQRLLHTKQTYGKNVKVEGWEQHAERQRVDQDPNDPEHYSLHLSHYARLGDQDVGHFETTTRQMLRSGSQAQDKPKVQKALINFFTFPEIRIEEYPHCRDMMVPNDYVSTMQYGYQAPYPCEMGLVSLRVDAGMHRRMRPSEECKFLDDNLADYTKTLQKVKGSRHKDTHDSCFGF
ncbi:uncharacterized protein LOC132699897 [Cylas formicarius]|uniref:uncharacterized protein LOC132699897 n=1 Tax=Cylas formicarius TaxID=197179 RepID=UPI0029587625|nr:uncharacterized protein LOC132699897 [Cylas formicarius]